MLRLVFLLSLLLVTPALADGRADWPLYAWQQIKLSQCASDGTTIVCPLYHQRWDWKRNQWVDIAISLDLSRNTLQLTQRLTDNDRTDDDYVCVTALAVDAAGNNILAHHQNWHMRHGETVEESFTYRSAALASIAAFHIGSRQCRKGAGEDDAIYARALGEIEH